MQVWDKGWGKVGRKGEPDDKAEKGLCKIISITNLIILNSFVLTPNHQLIHFSAFQLAFNRLAALLDDIPLPLIFSHPPNLSPVYPLLHMDYSAH